MSAPSAVKRSNLRAFLLREAHWFARFSCLISAMMFWLIALSWGLEGRVSLLSAFAAVVAGVGCVLAWWFLGRMTATDIGLEE